MYPIPPKHAAEVYEWVIDYSADLATGETISTSTWVVDTGITKDSDSKTNTTTTIWVSSGTGGKQYKLFNTIVTSSSRTFKRTLLLPVIT